MQFDKKQLSTIIADFTYYALTLHDSLEARGPKSEEERLACTQASAEEFTRWALLCFLTLRTAPNRCPECQRELPEYTPNFPGLCKPCYVRKWGGTK